MNQFDIRHALEDKISEIGREIIGTGCLMVSPFTMDFSFMLGGKFFIAKRGLLPRASEGSFKYKEPPSMAEVIAARL
jgi:hypothetical protein